MEEIVYKRQSTERVSFRIDPVLLEELKKIAYNEHLGYQTLIKIVLKNYCDDYKAKKKIEG